MKSLKEILKTPNTSISGEQLEAFKRQREAEEREMLQQIMRENLAARQTNLERIFDENSLIPLALRNATFENYESANIHLRRAKEMAYGYAETFKADESKNLLLTGDYGVGKSHLAVSVLKRLIKRDFTGIFITVPELLTKIRSTYNKESNHTELQLLEIIKGVDCLVLDDIGTENGSDWAVSKLFEVVDGRLGKHTIYTTNLDSKATEKKIGERNFSRLMFDTVPVVMTGEDYRRRGFGRDGQ
ncbi:ATP-binding protein [Aneurinibacillus sp. Ricciae_BoGa-3]|uniref:ATP-binding protein n=1 Tax=Aneurinibacillus sp. Ricciae_BoGa-3 TaxID=3022697 RepID=UPI0023407F21|nr:ATP-binding protein [Aneurinibacillus sp. Ricciae_BoGa-3]WCK53865.1 ATP-binding protein [Aneurinibacillus sp. Ricciae_BoGa-3]